MGRGWKSYERCGIRSTGGGSPSTIVSPNFPLTTARITSPSSAQRVQRSNSRGAVDGPPLDVLRNRGIATPPSAPNYKRAE
jgi:hypothetical protein